jgi:hypothetical protein
VEEPQAALWRSHRAGLRRAKSIRNGWWVQIGPTFTPARVFATESASRQNRPSRGSDRRGLDEWTNELAHEVAVRKDVALVAVEALSAKLQEPRRLGQLQRGSMVVMGSQLFPSHRERTPLPQLS